MKKIYIIYILFISCNLFGQVSEEWIRTYNGSENANDEGRIIATDKTGNVFVAGSCNNLNTSLDYVTIKYNNLGIQQWINVYSGVGYNYDYINALTLDKSGNVYVTGASNSENNYTDYLTIKYDSNGIEQWTARFNGPANGDDWAYDIATDDSENVYVTGQCYGSSITTWDYGTVKYNKNGIQQWVTLYNGIGNTNDGAIRVKVDKNRNVYVTGGVNTDNFNSDYTTVKYNSSGIQEWFAIYNGSANGIDSPTSMDLDTLGNVYVTGISESVGTGNDYATLKYNTNGNLSWVAKYNGSSNSGDSPSKIKVINPDCIIITGYCKEIGKGQDIVTIKYNSLGISQWVSKYSGFAGSRDVGYDLAADNIGNVYITGVSLNDCITIKYNPLGIEQWIQSYNGIQNNSIALDMFGNVYVTGYGIFPNHEIDIITIKYSQIPQIRVSLNLLFEGMYYPIFNQMIRKDTAKVYLRNIAFPYDIVDSAKGIIDSLSFSNIFAFFNAPSGTYYITVKHFNSIETWSKSGGETLAVGDMLYNYDFTTSALKAYGNNLKLKGGKYCIFGGNVNGDAIVDASDLSDVDNDSYAGLSGRFLKSDVNGDGFVDASDITIVDNNRAVVINRPYF